MHSTNLAKNSRNTDASQTSGGLQVAMHSQLPRFYRVCILYAVVRPSIVCNVRAPYSVGWNFRQCFYAIWYVGHPLTPGKILRRSSQGHPSVEGLNARGVAEYSDFGLIENNISETMQDRR